MNEHDANEALSKEATDWGTLGGYEQLPARDDFHWYWSNLVIMGIFLLFMAGWACGWWG